MRWVQQLPVVLVVLVLIAVATFVTVNVVGGSTLADGPVDVVWDREICAHCRMHVGDPAFAVQVQTGSGRVLSFDDPGCAFQLLEAAQLEVHAMYFRHHAEDRWIEAERAAFVEVAQSPMGFGFAAVDVGDPGARSLDEARTRMRRKN